MKLLLMGGSVFVGRALLKRLVSEGAEVVAITRGLVAGDWSGVEHLQADRTHLPALRQALAGRRFDAVVDASCYTARDCSTLLDALDGPAPIHVMLSSAAVYDRRRARFPFKEHTSVGGDPIWGQYGVDKYAAERVLTAASAPKRPGRACILRPPYIYGPGNNLAREQFVWARALAGRPVCIPGNGESLLQFCHIDDLASVVLSACRGELAEGVFNVAGPEFLTAVQWVRLLADTAQAPVELHHVTDPATPVREYFPFREAHLILDTQRIAQALNHSFKAFEEGAVQTLHWFKQNVGFDIPVSAAELRILGR